MIEPVSASAFGLGVFGNFLKNCIETISAGGEAHHAYRHLIGHLKERLNDGRVPANHDLNNAIEQSLLEAARAFALGVAAQLDPQPALFEAISRQLRDFKFDQPLLDMLKVPGRDWVQELLKESHRAQGDRGIEAEFILDENEVTKLLVDRAPDRFQQRVNDAFAGWLERHVQNAAKPDCVNDFLTKGWPVEKNSNARITFYQAFCLFFHEKVKHRPEVVNILLAQTLSKLAEDQKQLATLPEQVATILKTLNEQKLASFDHFQEFLDSQFSKLFASLTRIETGVSRLETGQTDLKAGMDLLLDAIIPPTPVTISHQATSAELKSKIEEARSAARKHDEENAVRLWEEVGKQAEKEGNKAIQIRSQLEVALLHLRNGDDLDDVLSVLNQCIQDAKSVDLGDDRSRLLQLLGEAHRLKGNFDQARGFLTSALEHSRTHGHKLDEGWALLALSALEKTRGKRVVSTAGLDLIQQAYDCFSTVYASGDQEKQRAAKEGFASCHLWRAAIFDHLRLDDAMAEYARAIDVFRELGTEQEWGLADVLFQRGDLHARADDPQLAGKDLIAASELFKKLGDRLMEAKCVMGIAELLDHVGRRLESKDYYQTAAAIAMQQKNPKRSAFIFFRYACKLGELREFEQEKKILMTLLNSDWIKPRQRLDVLKMLCLTAMATGQKQEMELYSKSALEIIDSQIAQATSADERRRLIISKGQSLEELNEHDRAISCFRRGIEAFEAINDRHGLIECWSHIAQAMGKTKKRKEEREAYEKVLVLIGDERESFFRPMALTMLAQLDIFEKHFDEARKRLDQAEQENQKLLNPMVMLLVQDLRSKLPGKGRS